MSVKRDDCYNALAQDIGNPKVSDEDVFIDFLEFCKKFDTSPAKDHNVQVLFSRMLEDRPNLQNSESRSAIFSRNYKKKTS